MSPRMPHCRTATPPHPGTISRLHWPVVQNGHSMRTEALTLRPPCSQQPLHSQLICLAALCSFASGARAALCTNEARPVFPHVSRVCRLPPSLTPRPLGSLHHFAGLRTRPCPGQLQAHLGQRQEKASRPALAAGNDNRATPPARWKAVPWKDSLPAGTQGRPPTPSLWGGSKAHGAKKMPETLQER